MTTKTIKTILFASLMLAMILPFSGMNYAHAETNEELLEQHNRMFGSNENISDEMKIIAVQNFNQVQSDLKEGNTDEMKMITMSDRQLELLNQVNGIYELLETTDDKIMEKSLYQMIENLTPELLENGLVPKDNVSTSSTMSADDIYTNYLENEFSKMGLEPATDEQRLDMISPVSHTSNELQVYHYISYTCTGGWVVCYLPSSGPIASWVDIDLDEPNSVVGTISGGDEFNQVHFWSYLANQQSGYHTISSYSEGIMMDSNSNYLDGDSQSYLDRVYGHNEYRNFNYFNTYENDNDNKFYQYIYAWE